MKFAKSILAGTGAVVLAGLILALLAPNAAHAIVATAVQVENTRSTPVPNQDVDIPARHPYQQTCEVSGIGDQFCTMPVVPQNTEVVIQTVSIRLASPLAPNEMQLLTTGGGVNIAVNIPFTAQANGIYIATQPLTQYADPGSNAVCLSGTGGQLTTTYCAISGYFVTLP